MDCGVNLVATELWSSRGIGRGARWRGHGCGSAECARSGAGVRGVRGEPRTRMEVCACCGPACVCVRLWFGRIDPRVTGTGSWCKI